MSGNLLIRFVAGAGICILLMLTALAALRLAIDRKPSDLVALGVTVACLAGLSQIFSRSK